MKKQIFLLPLIFSAFLAITSCVDDDGIFRDCESGNGPVVEEVLNISEFTGLKLKIAADVFITQGDAVEVVAKGEQNVIDGLDLSVRNDIWDVEFDNCMKNYELKIFVTMPDVDFLSITGSGDIIGETFIDSDDITLRITGSGDMCLGLTTDNIDAKITGSGDMDLEGATQQLDFRITGSGDLGAFDLIAERADIEITGSGDANVNVVDFLKIKITGSGDVLYKGSPELDINISGSGKVRDAN